jgi:hypothetical protein
MHWEGHGNTGVGGRKKASGRESENWQGPTFFFSQDVLKYLLDSNSAMSAWPFRVWGRIQVPFYPPHGCNINLFLSHSFFLFYCSLLQSWLGVGKERQKVPWWSDGGWVSNPAHYKSFFPALIQPLPHSFFLSFFSHHVKWRFLRTILVSTFFFSLFSGSAPYSHVMFDAAQAIRDVTGMNSLNSSLDPMDCAGTPTIRIIATIVWSRKKVSANLIDGGH